MYHPDEEVPDQPAVAAQADGRRSTAVMGLGQWSKGPACMTV